MRQPQGAADAGQPAALPGPALPVLFQGAFRICFLLGAAWALLSVPLWLVAYDGWIDLAPAYGAVYWHAHELIFGYVAVVLCGFLFTAIPNWTGRLPVSGWPLAGLVLLWLAGRVAMLTAAPPYLPLAAVIDIAFLVVVLLVAVREIAAGRNWRNLRVVVLVLWLAAGNVFFHVTVIGGQSPDVAIRVSLGAVIVLITLMGGRLTPSFTHSWLKRRGAVPLPPSFSRIDGVAIGGAVVGVAAWIVFPEGTPTAVLALAAAALLAMRLVRWRGWMVWREPLLFVLHAGYAFLAVGFTLAAASALWSAEMPQAAAVHAWTVGAIGTMTLAVMTRASLGHTGRELAANGGTTGIYIAIIAAAVLRIGAAFAGGAAPALLSAAGLAWALAFLGFLAVYGPILARPRLR
jgi:uncharacterized protein involved in response to NO